MSQTLRIEAKIRKKEGFNIAVLQGKLTQHVEEIGCQIIRFSYEQKVQQMPIHHDYLDKISYDVSGVKDYRHVALDLAVLENEIKTYEVVFMETPQII